MMLPRLSLAANFQVFQDLSLVLVQPPQLGNQQTNNTEVLKHSFELEDLTVISGYLLKVEQKLSLRSKTNKKAILLKLNLVLQQVVSSW